MIAEGAHRVDKRRFFLPVSRWLRYRIERCVWTSEMRLSSETGGLRRLCGLDLIRALAIIWVMLFHATLFDLAPAPDHWLFRDGWMGVDLFFVLSGYLIAGQLLEPLANGAQPNYIRFFARRALRTLPAYTVVVVLCFLVPSVRDRAEIQPMWQFLTFTQNLFIDAGKRTALSHAWSLCVEEQFYLIFPALVATLVAATPTMKRVAICLLVVLIAGTALRGFFWLRLVAETPFDVSATADYRRYLKYIYYPTWCRLDGLSAGVAISVIRSFRRDIWLSLTARPNLLALTGVAGIAASILVFDESIGRQGAGFIPTTLGFPLLSLGIAAIVMAGTDCCSVIGRYKIPGAEALATASYSIYLTHKLVFHAVGRLWPGSGITSTDRLLVAIVAALVVGGYLYWLVERTFLDLRARLDAFLWPTPAVRAPAQHRLSDFQSQSGLQ